jgi:hypothetical protein
MDLLAKSLADLPNQFNYIGRTLLSIRRSRQIVKQYPDRVVVRGPGVHSSLHIAQQQIGSVWRESTPRSPDGLAIYTPTRHGVMASSAHPEKTPPSPRSTQSYGDIVAIRKLCYGSAGRRSRWCEVRCGRHVLRSPREVRLAAASLQEAQDPIRIQYPALRHRLHRFQYGQVRKIQLSIEAP